MKKTLIFTLLTLALITFYKCTTSKIAKKITQTTNYEKNILPIIAIHCSPCHLNSQNGKKTNYESFENTKSDIDDIIRRIELNPGERGYMPLKKQKLSDSTIALFKQWKADGLLQQDAATSL